MPDIDARQVLIQFPARLPLTVVSAVGNLIDAALDGAMLGPGDGRAYSAEVHLRDDMTVQDAVQRLQHATAAVQGVEYTPEPVEPAEDPLVLNRMSIDEDTGVMSMGVGGAKETAELAAKNLLSWFMPYLDEQKAENYVQWDVMVPQRDENGNWAGPDQRLAFICVRPGGKTPHELRKEAEAALAKCRKRRSRKASDAASSSPEGTQQP